MVAAGSRTLSKTIITHYGIRTLSANSCVLFLGEGYCYFVSEFVALILYSFDLCMHCCMAVFCIVPNPAFGCHMNKTTLISLHIYIYIYIHIYIYIYSGKSGPALAGTEYRLIA